MASSRFHELNPNNSVVIIFDFIAILLSFALGIFLAESYFKVFTFDQSDLKFFIAFITFSVSLQLSILAVGLYNEKLRETYRGVIVRLLVALALSYIISSVFYHVTSTVNLFLIFNGLIPSIVFISLCLFRFVLKKTKLNQISKKRILVLGAGQRASIIENTMRRASDRVGIEFVGFVPMKGDARAEMKREPVIELTLPLESFVNSKDIDEIIIAADERRGNLPFEALFLCKQHGVQITDIIDFVERETGQIAVSYLNPTWVLFNSNQSTNRLRNFSYWAFNSMIALIILLFTWPFMFITFLLIKFENGLSAPVLYSQERVGLNGRNFSIFKFRSMTTDAEKHGVSWAQKEDPRVTKVGKYIRKFRIDELPQLYNVLIGDMYFVGPRPERPQFTESFDNSIPYYNQRHNVKPGLTGWAQLKYPYGSSEKDALEKLKFDLYYIKHRSFLLDLLILLKTSEIILFGKGQ
ncbi:TIGR03013 family PEP-CTERM/XrtA system glycosyltransferase [Photobacterium sp. BZF1]|uniref:TIGR03013 family XrtA/PEP-CTERM system glycosyltransferase n=1 Tax=Photobacterium sp. BZF1 TaxID=1904457 RepID=UPI001653E862|nr:TIGR03013 family XrtA/PEP-CTERM system glycosyltransferase [Photobacterium sp. BZF1]MBC7004735.1 TIGR03013 family PEP-CTERM/XrtA system glycosyltransferase [Photobacterium sp. BZF1]